MPQEGKYTGTALIYKGSINLGALNSQENIITQYGSHVEGVIDQDGSYVEGVIDLTTPVNKYIKIKIINDDKERLKNDLNAMVTGLVNDLQAQYVKQGDLTDKQIKIKEKSLVEAESLYNGKIKDSVSQTEELKAASAELMSTMIELESSILRMDTDLDIV